MMLYFDLKILSYGGYLSFTVFYDVLKKSSSYKADDVIIKVCLEDIFVVL